MRTEPEIVVIIMDKKKFLSLNKKWDSKVVELENQKRVMELELEKVKEEVK